MQSRASTASCARAFRGWAMQTSRYDPCDSPLDRHGAGRRIGRPQLQHAVAHACACGTINSGKYASALSRTTAGFVLVTQPKLAVGDGSNTQHVRLAFAQIRRHVATAMPWPKAISTVKAGLDNFYAYGSAVACCCSATLNQRVHRCSAGRQTSGRAHIV